MGIQMGCVPLGELGANCYLLKDEATGRSAVIDPGGQPEVLEEILVRNGMALEAVYLTHGHYDHTGGVAGLVARHPGLRVYVHAADRALGASHPGALMPDVALATDSYDEGDTLWLGETAIRVLHTPGHTPGGVCLAVAGVLFTGDTLFEGSMGRTDFPGGDETAIKASLRRLAALDVPEGVQVYPGHGGATTLARERKNNPFMRQARKG